MFEDAAESGRFRKTFMVDSWIEHLRQYERVTKANEIVQDAVNSFHVKGEPKVTHFISAEAKTRV